MILEFSKATHNLNSGLKMALRAFLGLFCLGIVLWSQTIAPPVIAQVPPSSVTTIQAGSSLDELQKQKQQLEQKRSNVSKERDRLRNLEQAAQGHLKGLQKRITATASQIEASEARLEQATQQLQSLEVALVKAEQAYRQKQFGTVARLRFLQRQQIERGWAVLLQSQNLNEFLDRRRQLKLVYATDRQMLVNLKDDADRIDHQRDQVEQRKNEIGLLKQQLLAQKSSFEAQADAQEDMIGRLNTDRRALEAAETQLLQDSKSIGSLIQQKMATQFGRGIALRGTGQMIYPCGGEITSGFGWRTHPILGYQRFHSGIDFGADYGTAIHAADRGTVIFAGWYGGYGNAVIIDHGNGISTLYGHTSELYVSEGQTVQRGQPIAAVGSTGLSTGPHLHFEVRRNGDPVDPVAFL